MSPKTTAIFLSTFLLFVSCDNERQNELQTVEVTSAALRLDLILHDPIKMSGRTLKCYHEFADKIKLGPLSTVPARDVRIDASNPEIIELPVLPKLDLTNAIVLPEPTRPEPNVVNAGFPDYRPTLPPRYKDAANFDFQYLDVTQGMTSSFIFGVEEDEEGYLWFGTYGGGIARYDGRSLVRFTENQGLPSSYVWGIEESVDGNLWIATYGAGVSMFDGKSFTNYGENQGLGTDYTFCIKEDIEGNIWIGTDGAGVIKFDGVRFTTWDEEHGMLSDRVIDILQDDHRNYWFACYNGGVCKFDGESFTYLNMSVGLPSNNILCIEQDNAGNIWIGTEDAGVTMYDGKSIIIYNEDNGLPSNYIHDISKGNNEEVWFATEGAGVVAYKSGSFYSYTEKEGVSSEFVRSCFLDDQGNMWFGTDGGGINRYHPGSFRHYTVEDGIISNLVWTTFEDSKGNIWFGTDGSGACKFDGQDFTYFTKEDGLADDIVLSIIEDDEGNIWFGTDLGGISIYDGESFTNVTLEEGLPSLSIWDMMQDSKGNIWIATNDSGLCKFNGTHYTYYSEEDGLLSNTVTQVMEDSDGDIWMVCEEKGISEFNGKEIRHYTSENGLSSDYVRTIYEDSYGDMWIGHNGNGLDKIEDGKTITRFTDNQGLASNYVWSITEDNDERLWVCTELGISCIKLDSNMRDSKLDIHTFTKQDGLKSLDFYTNSVMLDTKNRLWWGSSQAVTMLDLDNLKIQTSKPDIHLTNVMINESNVDYSRLPLKDSLGFTYSSVDQHENVPVGLELDYDKNHLTFHFAGIDWNSPQKIQYSYLLEGVDDYWSNPGPENKADYRNIPVGEHTFMVKAISSNGIWSDPIAINFIISPPWWQTWWAIFLYVLFLVGLTSLAYKFRTIKFRKRQLILEKTVKRRTAEIWTQKQEIEKQQQEVLEAYSQLEDKTKEVLASINYAKRIQNAILPSDDWIKELFPESFVLYMPKDIVAGDFYWCEKVDDLIFVAAADCTGHGVPGAMVSVICHNALNKALHEHHLTDPGLILDKAREIVIDKFEQSVDGIKDGMDISLAVINIKTKQINWAGANNPLWIIRKDSDELEEFRADKQPIGKYPSSKPFTSHDIKFNKGDIIYLMTDGYPDQFGGPKGKKYKVENLKALLMSIREVEVELQPYKLKQTFAHWKGEMEQIDDVCIIGIKL